MDKTTQFTINDKLDPLTKSELPSLIIPKINIIAIDKADEDKTNNNAINIQIPNNISSNIDTMKIEIIDTNNYKQEYKERSKTPKNDDSIMISREFDYMKEKLTKKNNGIKQENTTNLKGCNFRGCEQLGEIEKISLNTAAIPSQYPHLIIQGTFFLTNFKINFKPSDPNFIDKSNLKNDYFAIPLGFISKFDKSTSSNIVLIDIHSKDGRSFKFKFIEKMSNETLSLYTSLCNSVFPERKELFFAFEYNLYARNIENIYRGWKQYDIIKEFKRQGLSIAPIESDTSMNNSFTGTKQYLYKYIDNRNFHICDTYPQLLVIPNKITEDVLINCTKFRSKARIPVICYYSSSLNTLLARSSQSKPGISKNRCVEDEKMLRYLGNPNFIDQHDNSNPDINLHIYDARPYINAIANQVKGKGYEDIKHYKNCEISFLDIENLHHVRDSHKKLLSLCFNSESPNPKWLSALESTSWLEIISLILTASSKIVSSMQKGKNCLVHCSDGWDRTAQIVSLVQILIDPYFRTIKGLEILIEKEWVYFGHSFYNRLGHAKTSKDGNKAPIFLQFLDCVHQLHNQYPYAFEYNIKFLNDIIYHAHTGQFGNFLCNDFKEIVQYKMMENTISLWSFLNSNLDNYMNPYYIPPKETDPKILYVDSQIKNLRLWEEHFLYYSITSKPYYNLIDEINFHSDFYELMCVKEKKKIKELENEVEFLKKQLREIQTINKEPAQIAKGITNKNCTSMFQLI